MRGEASAPGVGGEQAPPLRSTTRLTSSLAFHCDAFFGLRVLVYSCVAWSVAKRGCAGRLCGRARERMWSSGGVACKVRFEHGWHGVDSKWYLGGLRRVQEAVTPPHPLQERIGLSDVPVHRRAPVIMNQPRAHAILSEARGANANDHSEGADEARPVRSNSTRPP